MSSDTASKTEMWTKGFCQSTGSTVHALSAKIFDFLYSFTGFPKKRMQKVTALSAGIFWRGTGAEKTQKHGLAY